MKYKIKKDSKLWNEYLGGLEFEKGSDFFYDSCHNVNYYIERYEDCFEPIEEKEFTKGDMLDFTQYRYNNDCASYSTTFDNWLKQRK